MNIEQLINDHTCAIICSHSGGKDSQAMYNFLLRIIPDKSRLFIIHAHLPGVEWQGVREHIKETITSDYREVTAGKTFFEMVRHRGAWPSPKYRQCTSDLKRGPIRKEIRKICRQGGFTKVLDCMGLRAEESAARSKQPIFKREESLCLKDGSREWYRWLPIHEWTQEAVFSYIAACGQKPHWAYSAGMSRLSCVFCIMSSQADLATAARLNPELLEQYSQLEEETGQTFFMPDKKYGRRTIKQIIQDHLNGKEAAGRQLKLRFDCAA